MFKKQIIKNNTVTILITSVIKSVEFETNVKFEKEYVDELSFCCEKFINLNENIINGTSRYFKCKIPHDNQRDIDNKYVPLRMVLGNMANTLYQYKLSDEKVKIQFVCDTKATYYGIKRCIQALTRDTQEGEYILEHLKELKDKENVIIIEKFLKSQGKEYKGIFNIDNSNDDKLNQLQSNLLKMRNNIETLKKEIYEIGDIDNILDTLDEISGALGDGSKGAVIVVDHNKKQETISKLKNLIEVLGA